jgi:tetratricopeptide (TPR) repeat protein
MGGIASGAEATVYYVPWVFMDSPAAPPGDLLVYWFPTGPADAQGSPMRTSRSLTNWAAHCVGVGLVPDSNANVRQQFLVEGSQPAAVIATKDGKEIGRVGAVKGKLSVRDVEKIVAAELKTRETSHAAALKDAATKEKSGDADGAAALYREVAGDGCLFPSLAKKAEKALDRLGKPSSSHVADGAADAPTPRLDDATNRRMTRLMEAGLAAERRADLERAQRLYEEAHALDPGDVVPMRFLGEFHRHQTGDWAKATEIFQAILDRPADRLSRAVALHGLGKMTIHSGEFQRGVVMFEQSIAEYPLAMAYRNLAVYWNSEHDFAKAYGYVQKAMALDPDEPFNIIFAATYLIELGRTEEAVAIATRHDDMMAASYNLAAIYAQAGDREKMLAYLKRHFYEYEEFDAVRAMEMTEARDDVVFARYHQDPEFVALTALADSDAASFHMKAESR